MTGSQVQDGPGQHPDWAVLRKMIAGEVAMWGSKQPSTFSYAEGMRDGLKAALQYMDVIDRERSGVTS